MSDVLSSSVSDGIATLLMNRPAQRNALNAELVDALRGALDASSRDSGVRVVLLQGAGRDFCSGADLQELAAMVAKSPEDNLEDAHRLGKLFLALRHHPVPVIAAVHGRALGGGAGLATACDIVLAREDARLGYPEVRLGFVPALVSVILTRKVGEARAFELVTRGEQVSAREAERIGLVNRILPDASFAEDVCEYARELASRPATAVALTKSLLYGLDDMGFEEGMRRGAEVNALARSTDACRAGVRRFLQDRT